MRDFWIREWRRNRAEAISQYRRAYSLETKRHFRFWALHYGRLVRKLNAGAS